MAAKQSTTVRISEQTHHRLREMAAQSGEPIMDGLDPDENWSFLRTEPIQNKKNNLPEIL